MEHNKLYSKPKIIKQGSAVSKVKYNREYLASKSLNEEMNTYVGFSPFKTFNDIYASAYKEGSNGEWVKDPDSERGTGTPGVRSLFNKAGAVVLGSKDGSLDVDVTDGTKVSSWRISNNVPLIDSREARRKIRAHSGCTVRELVEASKNGLLGRNTYSYSDFMYCKHLGKVSNNYLITLRRFPLPVDDFISALGEEERLQDFAQSKNSQSIGCLVTWLGTPGNEINNILKYSVSMPFKEQTAQWEDSNLDADANTGTLNGIAAAFDSAYRKQYMAGEVGSAFNGLANKFMPSFFELGPNPYSAREINGFQDRNKVYGPVDAIKKVYMRSDEGINFEQSFTLVFDYELRSYNGING